jgi:hypothetical protein
MSESTAPARRYSWPPFQPGNDVGKQFERGNDSSLTHGANSLAIVEPRARELGAVVFSLHEHLDPARDADAVGRLAMCLSRIERIYWWLSEQDDPVFADAAKGKIHGVYERLERAEREARQADAALGLSPLARVRLGLDLLEGRKRQSEADRAEEKRAQDRMRERLAELNDGGEDGDE